MWEIAENLHKTSSGPLRPLHPAEPPLVRRIWEERP
jgi:hypothetical protein